MVNVQRKANVCVCSKDKINLMCHQPALLHHILRSWSAESRPRLHGTEATSSTSADAEFQHKQSRDCTYVTEPDLNIKQSQTKAWRRSSRCRRLTCAYERRGVWNGGSQAVATRRILIRSPNHARVRHNKT